MSSQQLFAQVASASYDPSHLRPQNIDGWSIDDDLSDSRYTVYHKDGKAIMGIRGTSTNTLGLIPDIETNVMKFTHQADVRDLLTARKFNQVQGKYGGKENVVATGHSLAGLQAIELSRRTGVESHAFNPATQLANHLGWHRKPETTTIYRTSNDPVSSAWANVADITIPGAEGSFRETHSITQFGGGMSDILYHRIQILKRDLEQFK